MKRTLFPLLAALTLTRIVGADPSPGQTKTLVLKNKDDANWPKLVEIKAGQKNPIDSLLGRSVLAQNAK